MDEKNIKIYRLLNKNGRTTLSDVAEELKLSSPSVKERLGKLIKNRDISVRALLNVRKKMWKAAMCCMKIGTMEEALKIAEKFKNCPRVVFLTTLTGRHNLLIVFVAKNTTILECTIENDIKTIPSIEELDISIGEVPMIPEYLDMKLEPSDGPPPCGSKPCSECFLYGEKCDGCPATFHWKGCGSS